MDVTLLIWVVALTILVVVGVVWVLDMQSRMRRLQQHSEALFAGDGEDDANLAIASGWYPTPSR